MTHYSWTKESISLNRRLVKKNIKNIKTKKGDQMAIIRIYDETGEIEVTIFPKVYDLVKGYLVKNSIIIVTGRFDINDRDTFIADNIERLVD